MVSTSEVEGLGDSETLLLYMKYLEAAVLEDGQCIIH